jgi:hypothetical protein
VSVELDVEANAQLQRIADLYHLSHNAAIQQAIAKWFHTDPVVTKPPRKRRAVAHVLEEKVDPDGASHS